MKQKGFTLIELLAVIVILAVIALIATPLIMNVINDSKKSAAQDSGYSIVRAGELDAASTNKIPPIHYDETSNLELKGTLPTKFNLDFNDNMDASLKAWINGYCVVKSYDSSKVTVDESKKTEADCVSGGMTSLEVCELLSVEGKSENGIGWKGAELMNISSSTGEYDAAGTDAIFKGHFIAGKSIRIYFIAIDGYTVQSNMQKNLTLDDGTEVPVQGNTSGPTMAYIDFTLPKTVSQFHFPLYLYGSGSKPGDSIVKLSMQCN